MLKGYLIPRMKILKIGKISVVGFYEISEILEISNGN